MAGKSIGARVIIAGGRDFSDYELLVDSITYYCKDMSDMEIVSGGAKGADSLGEKFAEDAGIPVKIFPANWDAHGKKAGYLRNREMAEYAAHCICFWDGKSKGTEHMINLAKEYGLNLRVVRYEKV